MKNNLSVNFCGFSCENPFLLSSSCVAANEEMVSRAFDMGWGGAVFKTIGFFHPEEVSPRYDNYGKEGIDFFGFRNIEQDSDHSLEENLQTFYSLKKKYPHKLLVASLMGKTEKEWEDLARVTTEAGVDMIECNFSCPHMAEGGTGAAVGVLPEMVKKYSQAVRRGTDLPVLAKMTPDITDMTIPAKAAIEGGATGLAAINTIKSITNIVDSHRIQPDINGKSCASGYSGKAVKPIALRFISDMATCPELKKIPISGMGGIDTWHDALEFLLLGATTVQVTTSVMQYGYRIIEDMIDGLTEYMQEYNVKSVQELIGSSLPYLTSTQNLDSSSVLYPKWDMGKCVGCGRCYISCEDSGHQAIYWNSLQRQPYLNREKCVGCHLCKLVCPVDAIVSGTRVQKITG